MRRVSLVCKGEGLKLSSSSEVLLARAHDLSALQCSSCSRRAQWEHTTRRERERERVNAPVSLLGVL